MNTLILNPDTCTHTHTHTHIYIYIYICMNAHTHTHTHTCMNAHTYVHTHTHTHTEWLCRCYPFVKNIKRPIKFCTLTDVSIYLKYFLHFISYVHQINIMLHNCMDVVCLFDLISGSCILEWWIFGRLNVFLSS